MNKWMNNNSSTFYSIKIDLYPSNYYLWVPPQIFTKTLVVFLLNNNNFMQRLLDNLGETLMLYLTLAKIKFTS